MFSNLSLALVTSALWLWSQTLLAFIVIIFIIAFIHEYGHFVLCKLLGVRVDEFSIGLGKLLWSKQWGETLYCVRAIPIAAYVRPAGMNSDEAQEEGYVDPKERSFNNKRSLIKHLILLAGPTFNFVSTVLVLTAVYSIVGQEESTIKVKEVRADWPAAQAGIVDGDIFLDMDGEPIKSQRGGIEYINERPDKVIAIKIQRAKEFLTIKVTPKNEDGVGRIGIISTPHILTHGKRLPVMRAFNEAVVFTVASILDAYRAAMKMLKHSVKGRIPEEIGGPVGIVRVVGSQVEHGGILDLIQVFALLSMAIGVFNLLPIPGLDGGRMFVIMVRDLLDIGYTLIFWRRPSSSVLTDRMEEYVNMIGILALILLLVIVTFKDCRDIFKEQRPLTFKSPAPSPSAMMSSPSPLPSPVLMSPGMASPALSPVK